MLKMISNALLNKAAAKTYPTKPLYYPTSMQLEVSKKCNLKCYRCEREAVPKEMLGKTTSLELVEAVRPMFPYLHSVSLCSGLGEPLLNPNIFDIIETISKAGPKISITNNGTLANKKIAERLLNLNIWTFSFSLDSLNKEIYEKIRIGAKFENTIENIKNFCNLRKELKRKLPITYIGMTLQSNTIKEMPDMLKFASETGIDFVYFTSVVAHRKVDIKDSTFNLDPNYVFNEFQKARRVAKKLKIGIRLPEIFIEKNKMCESLWNDIYVYYNGDVSPCAFYRCPKTYFFTVEGEKIVQKEVNTTHAVVGNVYKENIFSVWNSERWKSLRRSMKAGNALPPCKTCFIRYGIH